LDNIAIARLLSETADLMEIAEEDGFRIRSYRNAAGVIEGYPEQVTAILGDPSRKLTEITGIGKGIAAVIGEVVARGSFERRDELLKRYPPTALEMLRIPGLGPKTIRALWDHFRVSTLEELEHFAGSPAAGAAAHGGKHEEKILKGLAHYRQGAGRYLLGSPRRRRVIWWTISNRRRALKR